MNKQTKQSTNTNKTPEKKTNPPKKLTSQRKENAEMLQAVKMHTKLHPVGEVSPVLVGLKCLWKNSTTISGIILGTLFLFNHASMSGYQFYGRHFILTFTHLWPKVTPLGPRVQTWFLSTPLMTIQSLWNSVSAFSIRQRKYVCLPIVFLQGSSGYLD